MLKLSRRNFTKYLSLSLVVMIAIASFNVHSANANTNKISKFIALGRVGEQPNGLVALVDPRLQTPGLTAMIERVNAERMEEYKKIAEANGADIEQVQRLAGKELIRKLKPGSYYKTEAGDWMRKQ